MLTGDNGILTRANEAKVKTERSEKDEKTNLAQTEDLINEYVNGIEVEQVTDTAPGVLETEETDTYVINSIEDLVFFAYDVREENTYEGKTVKLGLSLDFNSTKSYVDPLRTDYEKYGYNGELKTLLTSGEGFFSIGTTSNNNIDSNSFAGIFDGNYNIINNLYINQSTVKNEEMRLGLFGNNNGVIKNLGITNVNISLIIIDKTIDVGGIAAKNYNSIINCYCTGDINAFAKDSVTGLIRIGGISSGSEGIVESCYHKGKIYMEGDANVSITIGGITSVTYNTTEKCYSDGKIEISTKNNDNLQIGGISGVGQGNINNCYNKKSITIKDSSTAESFIGGIVGQQVDGQLDNSYNLGKIKKEHVYTSIFLGAIAGQTRVNINNCYYLIESAQQGIGKNYTNDLNHTIYEKTEDIMKSTGFIDLLNQNNINIWKKDIDNINNGFPILNWQ